MDYSKRKIGSRKGAKKNLNDCSLRLSDFARNPFALSENSDINPNPSREWRLELVCSSLAIQ